MRVLSLMISCVLIVLYVNRRVRTMGLGEVYFSGSRAIDIDWASFLSSDNTARAGLDLVRFVDSCHVVNPLFIWARLSSIRALQRLSCQILSLPCSMFFIERLHHNLARFSIHRSTRLRCTLAHLRGYTFWVGWWASQDRLSHNLQNAILSAIVTIVSLSLCIWCFDTFVSTSNIFL